MKKVEEESSDKVECILNYMDKRSNSNTPSKNPFTPSKNLGESTWLALLISGDPRMYQSQECGQGRAGWRRQGRHWHSSLPGMPWTGGLRCMDLLMHGKASFVKCKLHGETLLMFQAPLHCMSF